MAIKVLTPIIRQASALGRNTYRINDESVPVNFRPTLRWEVRENAAHTVARTTIRFEVPRVRNVDGVFMSTEKAVCDVSIAVPQNVVETTGSVDMLDTMISALTKAKADIIAGALPSVAI